MYTFFVELLQPFQVLYLLLLVMVVLLWRRRLESRKVLLWLTIPLVGLTLICSPLVAYLAMGSLEWQYPSLKTMPADSDAIVALSGFAHRPSEPGGMAILGMDSQFRCLHVQGLYDQCGGCRIVVTGGKVRPDDIGPSLAEIMKDYLIGLGVRPEDILVEDQSSSTYENAVFSAPILKQNDIRKIVLVSGAAHMPRAVRCFEAQGVTVVPSGCARQATKIRWSANTFLPDLSSAVEFHVAAHEWLGIFVYWIKGRLSPQTLSPPIESSVVEADAQ